MKLNKITTWFKNYAEFIIYGFVLAGLMVWQGFIYNQALQIHQDLILTAYSLQILNIILSIAVLKRMRLLAQLLLLTAILFGAVIIYYATVLIVNVI